MKKRTLKILIPILCIVIIFACTVLGQVIYVLNCSYPIGSRVEFDKETLTLSVNDNDDIRILQLADTQISGLGDSLKSFGVIKRVVERAKPDVIVLTGDNIMDDSKKSLLKHYVKFFDKFQIPWATVMGNHDYSAKNIPLDLQCELYENSEYCLFKKGDVENSYGNYHYNVFRNSEHVYTLMFMDNAVEINDKHIAWYTQTVKSITDEDSGEVVQSMLFFHKPLIETYYGYYNTLYYNKPLEGERREGVAYVRRDVGIFNNAYRLNSTKTIIYGHNHRNNYSVDYYGIKLCFGTKSSRAAYHDRDLIGGSVYVLKPDNTIQIERIYV